MSGLSDKIARQIYIACERLGAEPDLLSIIGSYGDTLEDQDILDLMIEYNANRPVLHRNDH